jgi:lysophospholipase
MFFDQTVSLLQAQRRDVLRAPAMAAPSPAITVLAASACNTVPKGGRSRTLTMRDGVQVRFASWRPSGRPRGTMWVLQGRADFIEKYYETVRDLLARGFAVASFDWRGQGGSERLVCDPRKNHVESFEPFVRDLTEIMSRAAPRDLPRPFYALAHSMGGNVLLHALARDERLVDAAVLTAPMIALSPTLRPGVVGPLTKTLTACGWGGLAIPGGSRTGEVAVAFRADNLLTSCPLRYARAAEMVHAAPYLAVGRPTLGWVDAALRAMAALRDARPAGLPILMAAGESDRVTSTEAAIAHCAKLPAADVLPLANCAHEVLLETDAVRGRFWAAFDAFLPG